MVSFTKKKKQTKSIDFFSEDNWYFKDNIEDIEKLEVGTTFSPEKGHIITRVN